MPFAAPVRGKPLPTEPLLFADGWGRKIFRVTYRGAARPLRAYLLERYAHGRDAVWRAGFYPERVRLNGQAVGPATCVTAGDQVTYLHLRAEEPPPPPLGVPLHEDPWLVVLQKPDVIPVAPAGVYYFTSLVLLARERLGEPRLTPVHRLDLETAGPVMFVRGPGDAHRFHRLFQTGAIRKTYRALVVGRFPEEVREISGYIVPDPGSAIFTKLRLEQRGAGVPSLTRVVAVRHLGDFSELELEPVTGKTNQLRVQLAALGHPIVGDKKYHPDEGVFLDWLAHRDFGRLRARLHLPRQALLCERLELAHPFTGEPLALCGPPGAWQAKIGGWGAGAPPANGKARHFPPGGGSATLQGIESPPPPGKAPC